MLNAILACVTVVVWSASYVVMFQREIGRWWRLRHVRRAQSAAARARAVQAYAEWVRNIPPPRSRVAIMPVVEPAPVIPAPVRGGVVVPFPLGGRAALRR